MSKLQGDSDTRCVSRRGLVNRNFHLWNISMVYGTPMFKVHNPQLQYNICGSVHDSKYNLQGSHFSALTKFQDFPRILYKIPGIIFFFFNVASTYNWVSVYTLYITSTLFCLHYPKVCIPPLTATHNDLYHFERWVLIKKNRN